jgi:hypothetical protein
MRGSSRNSRIYGLVLSDFIIYLLLLLSNSISVFMPIKEHEKYH